MVPAIGQRELEAMTSPNTDIVRRAFHAVRTNDPTTVAALLDPGHVLELADRLPWGGHYVGFDRFCAFVSCLHEHLQWAPEVEALIESGPDLIVCGRTRGRAKATGLSFDVPFVNVYVLDAGRIVRSYAMTDEDGLRTALGGRASRRAPAPVQAAA